MGTKGGDSNDAGGGEERKRVKEKSHRYLNYHLRGKRGKKEKRGSMGANQNEKRKQLR